MTQQVNVRLPQPTINRLGELAEIYGSQAKAIIAAIENLHTKEIEMSKQTRKERKMITINIVAQSGHAWEEEVEDMDAALLRAEQVAEDHGDIERVEVLTDDGPEDIWTME